MGVPTAANFLLQTAEQKWCRRMYDLAWSGKLNEARQLYEKFEPLVKTQQSMKFVRPVGRTEHPIAADKYWQDLIGMAGGPVRPPTSPVSEEAKRRIADELEAHVASGLLKVPRLKVPVAA
jgi:4-hydroxy-tetrahydrodipicolinate synthase